MCLGTWGGMRHRILNQGMNFSFTARCAGLALVSTWSSTKRVLTHDRARLVGLQSFGWMSVSNWSPTKQVLSWVWTRLVGFHFLCFMPPLSLTPSFSYPTYLGVNLQYMPWCQVLCLMPPPVPKHLHFLTLHALV